MALEPTVGVRELTIANQASDEVCVRGHPIHPSPPTQLTERLQDAIARSLREPRYGSKTRWTTYKSNTKLNNEVNSNPATSGVGAIAATACPMDV